MFEDKCVWSALYPISNNSHIRQLQFATHAFSQQVLQQAVQISTCQWNQVISKANKAYSLLCPGAGGAGIYIDWCINTITRCLKSQNVRAA